MYFEFNGKSSKDFHIQINKIEDNETFGLSRTILKAGKTKYRYRSNHYGTQYDGDLTFTLTIMKDTCITPSDELEFTSDDIRKINAWLTSPQLPQLLQIQDDRYFDEEIFFYAIIKNVKNTQQRIRPIVLSYTVECDSPFGYSHLYERNIISSTTIPVNFSIENTSDEYELPIYPIFEISPVGFSNITIENSTDNKNSITLKGLDNNRMILDCQHTILKDLAGNVISFEDMGIENVDDIYFPRLIRGINQFKISGGCSVNISYREPRKVGVF